MRHRAAATASCTCWSWRRAGWCVPATRARFSSSIAARHSIGESARRVRYEPDFRMTDAQWDSLLIPIGLAFFVYCTPRSSACARSIPGRRGRPSRCYPWRRGRGSRQENPALRDMEPDVEALLVNRVGSARDHYIVPIDRCYRLAGLIRMRWHGLSGGEEVWREIGRILRGAEGGRPCLT